jgi:mono/diheme cytochrome c family protein
MIAGMIAALCFCGGYFVGFYSGHSTVAPIDSGAVTALPAQLPTDPHELGRVLYGSLCIACHQGNGLGVARQVPPLAGSEWVLGSDARLKRILLGGVNGPMHVGTNVFNNVMVPMGDRWDDAKIAAVLSFIRTQWGNTGAAISPESVAATRARTASRFPLWNEQDLLAVQSDDSGPAAASLPSTQPSTQPAGLPSR